MCGPSEPPCETFSDCPSLQECYPRGVIDYDGPKMPGCHCAWALGREGDGCVLTPHAAWPMVSVSLSLILITPALLLTSIVLLRTLRSNRGCGFALVTITLAWVSAVSFMLLMIIFLILVAWPTSTGSLLFVSSLALTAGAGALISTVLSVSLRWADLVLLSNRGVLLDQKGGVLKRSTVLLRTISLAFAVFSLVVVIHQASMETVTDQYLEAFSIIYLSMAGFLIVTVIYGATLVIRSLIRASELHSGAMPAPEAMADAASATLFARQRVRVVQRTAVGLVTGLVTVIAAGVAYYLSLGVRPRQLTISVPFLFLGHSCVLVTCARYVASTLPSIEEGATPPQLQLGFSDVGFEASWATGMGSSWVQPDRRMTAGREASLSSLAPRFGIRSSSLASRVGFGSSSPIAGRGASVDATPVADGWGSLKLFGSASPRSPGRWAKPQDATVEEPAGTPPPAGACTILVRNQREGSGALRLGALQLSAIPGSPDSRNKARN